MEDYIETSNGRWVDEDGIYSKTIQACSICDLPTRRIDINFEAPLHAGECYDRMWKEYLEALYGVKFNG